MTTRVPEARLYLDADEIIVDSFAGGGGASCGIEMAIGRSPDIAINHDAEAIALHEANHPESEHFCEDVWQVDPVKACRGRRVGIMWLSPDCKHFSKAKGGKPVSKKVRGLAWVAVRWAKAVGPRIIVLENVEEFQTWGPVSRETNRPDPTRKGLTFKRFVGRLRTLGYVVEWRELRACDFGAPTIRKRLFLIARCDGQPIVWPKPTHGKLTGLPWRSAAECIDWSIECPSIFGRKKPLAANTQRRIAAGLKRFVLESPRPFIVNMAHGGKLEPIEKPVSTIATEKGGCRALVTPVIVGVGGRMGQSAPRSLSQPYQTITAKADAALVAPVLVPRYGEREGQAPRALPVDRPLPTIVPTQNGASLVAGFLAKHFSERKSGEVMAASLFDPAPTVTTIDHSALVTARLSTGADHRDDVRAFLIAYFGNERDGGSLFDPMRTVTSRDRFGLVTIAGVDYCIADIGMRMLVPRELYRAQGFPDSYRIEIEFRGKPLSKTAQVRMCGNSVVPQVAAAIIAANVRSSERQAVAA